MVFQVNTGTKSLFILLVKNLFTPPISIIEGLINVKPDNIKNTLTGHNIKLWVHNPIIQFNVISPEKLCISPFVQCKRSTPIQAIILRTSIQIILFFSISLSFKNKQ